MKKEPIVCLCMIVKNESKIIERCFENCKPIIDRISICDTGSTDGTPEVIRAWGMRNKIPTKVHTSQHNLVNYIKAQLAYLGKIEKEISLDMKREIKGRFKRIASEISAHKAHLEKHCKISKLIDSFKSLAKSCDKIDEVKAEIEEFLSGLSSEKSEKDTKDILFPKSAKNDTKFINFGWNRTQSYVMAKKSFPEANYCLLQDADMTLKMPDFTKDMLTEPSYNLIQITGNLRYPNIRILRTDLTWECCGVTHEYWDVLKEREDQESQPKRNTMDVKNIWIDDKNDGGCKEDKFERDIRLFTEAIQREEHRLKQYKQGNFEYMEEYYSKICETECYKERWFHEYIMERNKGLICRYKFYLAQSYKDFNKPTTAINWYKKRIADAANGWEEETWHSFYSIGICYQRLLTQAQTAANKIKEDSDRLDLLKLRGQLKKKEDELEGQMLKWFMDAYNRRPWRCEPLIQMANYYREKGKNGTAFLYAYTAIQDYCRAGLNDQLFIETSMYTWEPYHTISICAYYIRRYREGVNACKKIMNMKEAPQWLKDHTQKEVVKYYNDIGFK